MELVRKDGVVETDPRKPWWLCHSPWEGHKQSWGCFSWSSHSFRQVLPSQVSVQGISPSREELPCPELGFLALEQGSDGAGEEISVPELHPTALNGGPCQQVFFQNIWWCWVGAWTWWFERFFFSLGGSMILWNGRLWNCTLPSNGRQHLYTFFSRLHFWYCKETFHKLSCKLKISCLSKLDL